MGMPCQVNAIVKLSPAQGYPASLSLGAEHHVCKSGYRIFPIDVPIPLVDAQWIAHADVIIQRLVWEQGNTQLTFRISRLYDRPFNVKG